MDTTPQSPRISAIDQLRGLVIVLMGLDHVRDFFSPFAFQPEDMSQTSPELFFTRWITHFCAPVFIFLTGVSAFLYGQKSNHKPDVSKFLLSRGIWLVFIEIVVINTSWKFALAPWIFLQVIWVIGVCMILLSVLIYLPTWLLLAGSLSMILGHNLLDVYSVENFDSFKWLWGFLHQQYWQPLNAQGAGVFFVYPLVPWIGVMTLGYVAARWLVTSSDDFVKRCITLGVAVTLVFIALRLSNLYGDPEPWISQERGGVYTLLSFLNTQKYPPSLLYLCMTLGPSLILLGVLQQYQTRISNTLEMFGRVPFFYYVVHVPLIHAAAVLWFKWQLQEANVGWQLQGANAFPTGYEPSLLRLYVAWIVVTGIMYFACRWFAGVKQRHNHWILKYL